MTDQYLQAAIFRSKSGLLKNKRKRKVHSAIEVVTDHERENKYMYPMTKRLNIALVYICTFFSNIRIFLYTKKI